MSKLAEPRPHGVVQNTRFLAHKVEFDPSLLQEIGVRLEFGFVFLRIQ